MFDTVCIAWDMWSEDSVVTALGDYSIVVCQNAAMSGRMILLRMGCNQALVFVTFVAIVMLGKV